VSDGRFKLESLRVVASHSRRLSILLRDLISALNDDWQEQRESWSILEKTARRCTIHTEVLAFDLLIVFARLKKAAKACV
jgi:hypothetical protein